MGCTSSKLDDLPAVALCHERCSHLDEAIRHRYAFADAHMAYITALKGVAHSMHIFLDSNFDQAPPSPVLNLPNQRKGDPVDPGHLSDSGSHLHFHSDEDSDGSESGKLHESSHASPSHRIEYMSPNQEGAAGFAPFQGGFLHMNYMKNTAAAPAVVYEQRPMSYETVQFGESSSSYFPYAYSGNNAAPNYAHPGYGGGIGGGGGGYGYSSPAPALQYSPSPAAPSMQEWRKPPSPPRSSGWDYLDPFGTSYADNFYEQYTPGRKSSDVREDEGIPELEDEVYHHEVVKEVHGHPKFIDAENISKSVAVDEEAEGHGGGKKPTPPAENNKVDFEVHVVDNKVSDADQKKPEEPQVTESKTFHGINDVMKEIELQFQRASESGAEIAGMLEVGKFPYRRKREGASKIVQAITAPPLPVVSSEASTSISMAAEPSSSAFEEEIGLGPKTISSTLHKLYLWEKKLYNEVKAEEKMRVIHDRKVQKLKRLDQRGAEAAKVDATRTFIRDLSTKIRIAIQVVDKISITINKIRDEELWPQLNELIQGLTRMWRCMLECHKIQSQAIGSASGFGSIGSGKTLSDTHLEATLQFEAELINWTTRFANWVSSQKGYIKSLNGWLSKCLLYEPEETPDGIIPFSPGRIGAPPVFIICNQWAQSLDTVSEKEVLDAMRVFISSVLQLWRQDKHEMRERMLGNKDLEKKMKNLDKKDVQIQKEVQALEKKVVTFTGISDDDRLLATDQAQAVYPGDASRNLQSSLQKIFEAMEKFMDSSSKIYEDLLHRCEEENVERRSAS